MTDKVYGEKKLVNSAIQEKMGIYIRQNKYEEAQKLVKTLNFQMLSKTSFQIVGHLYPTTNQIRWLYSNRNMQNRTDSFFDINVQLSEN